VATLGQAICALEEQLFVGRARELSTFEQWLSESSPQPEILNVYGPGGIGKSALIGAFRRIAHGIGRPTMVADARTFSSTPDELVDALGGGTLDGVVDRLNSSRSVVFLDGIEEDARRDKPLRERFLSRLDASLHVVVASRRSLARLWGQDDLWHKLIRPLALGGLARSDARTYLERRGLARTPSVLEQILALTGGHPLGLSLATDLVLRLRLSSLEAAPEWRLVIRSLVERLHDTDDAQLRELLEAAAILRQFDEATLLALVDRPAALAPFVRLCELSVVQPTVHGLTLHDDVRRILAEDLRWRDAERYETLRARADSYYRERTRRAPPVERARLACDWLFLAEQDQLHTALFGDEHSGDVRIDAGRATDQTAIHQAWQQWLGRQCGAHGDSLDSLLRHPGTRLRVARDGDEHVLGFAAYLPVSVESLPLFQQEPILASMVRAWMDDRAEHLPIGSASTQIFCHAQVPNVGAPLGPTLSVLLRESLEWLVQGGIHLACSPTTQHQAALRTLGFEPIAQSTRTLSLEGEGWGEGAMKSYVLDLSRTGVDSWLDALAAGRHPAHVKLPVDVERELRAILPHWRDDGCLSRSTLWELNLLVGVTPDHSPGKLRELVRDTLHGLESKAAADERLAYRAVDLAYLTPRLTNEAAAERLSVSRATFYRLLKRGVRGLASVLSTACVSVAA
jgi:hypothetical protein